MRGRSNQLGSSAPVGNVYPGTYKPDSNVITSGSGGDNSGLPDNSWQPNQQNMQGAPGGFDDDLYYDDDYYYDWN